MSIKYVMPTNDESGTHELISETSTSTLTNKSITATSLELTSGDSSALGANLTTAIRSVAGGGGSGALTWTVHGSLTTDTTTFTDICFGGGRFLASANNGKLYMSSDGASWAVLDAFAAGGSALNTICFGGGRFVAAGSSGRIVFNATENNFGVWSTLSTTYNPTYVDIVYLEIANTFMLQSASSYCYTIDANTLTTTSTITQNSTPASFAYSAPFHAKIFTCRSSTNIQFHYSTNGGISWITKTPKCGASSAAGYVAMFNTPSNIIAIVRNLPVIIIIDPSTFDFYDKWNLPLGASNASGCYGNNKCVVVVNTSKYLISNDTGESWAAYTLAASYSWRYVCYGNGKFVAITAAGVVATADA